MHLAAGLYPDQLGELTVLPQIPLEKGWNKKDRKEKGQGKGRWGSGVMTRGGVRGRDREEKVESYDPLGSSLML